MSNKKLIAIDIDDVVANSSEAVRLWVNENLGLNLTKEDYYLEEGADYWDYYRSVWNKHGVDPDQTKYSSAFAESQADIAMVPGFKEVVNELSEHFNIVFVTSRAPTTNEVTQKWFLDNLGYEVVIHFASAGPHLYGMDAPSKGEISKELGATYLVDDFPGHVQSALDYGVQGILFGKYGWQVGAPSTMVHIEDWAGVVEYLRSRE